MRCEVCGKAIRPASLYAYRLQRGTEIVYWCARHAPAGSARLADGLRKSGEERPALRPAWKCSK